MAMKILIIGGGGREHALAWKLATEGEKHDIYCAPGNGGTAAIATNIPIAVEDVSALRDWAVEEGPDLTLVGPEVPLCAGLVDAFAAEGLHVFGPNAQAAQLEGSKIFAKEIMQAAGVPTAQAGFFTEADAARAYAKQLGGAVVVKADGLAAGKGVSVCASLREAEDAIEQMLEQRVFGEAGSRILIEECLEGEEASIMALVDGEQFVMLAPSQDHKRAFDGDSGPNTGGMGAYSPTQAVDEDACRIIEDTVFRPVLAELAKRGIHYRGVLYAGIMMTAKGPSVLEFNCRFGDPETQVILPRMKSELLPLVQACMEGRLAGKKIEWHPGYAVCVVMASGGYPGSYSKGFEIHGLQEAASIPDTALFHAGTALQEGKIVTTGGRVLGVTALGPTIERAVHEAYLVVSGIEFQHSFHRQDIAMRELRRMV